MCGGEGGTNAFAITDPCISNTCVSPIQGALGGEPSQSAKVKFQ